MATKDFSKVGTGRVYDTITAATAEEKTRKERKTYTEEEARELMIKMNTTGRKGVKMPRINLAIAPDVYEYIQTMSRVRGQNMTVFVNLALREHMAAHNDIYEQALEFRRMLEEAGGME